MSMTYTELTDAIQQHVEDTFTAAQLETFVRQAEQLIHATVELPAVRANVTGSLSTGNKYVTLPDDFLYPYSIAVIVDGAHSYLLSKDVNFMREAYPAAATTGTPKHYAVFDEDTLILGPTPDADLSVEMHYARYPESIVDAGTSYLGEKFESALFSGALVQVARFQKSEEDIVKMYEKQYLQAVGLLKNMGDGKLRQDMYRSGQVRSKVN
jgi:hypothetical protein